MLSTDRVAVENSVLRPWPVWTVLVSPRPSPVRRSLILERTERVSRALERAPAATRDVVRTAAMVAIAITVWLSIVDVAQLAFPPATPGDLRAGIIASVIAIPLHLRHLLYGVRGERAPAGYWTLAALATVTFAGGYFAGGGWLREFTLLAVSILVVVPGRVGLVLFGAVVLSPLVFVNTDWYADRSPLPGIYFCSLIIWRTVTQLVPLRLLAALRALDSASRELEARAVVQARVRIDTELRESVGPALQQIITRGEAARFVAHVNPERAVAELQQLVRESRKALADARRVVARYRVSSIGAELDAAAALLGASGASVQIVAADGISLDSPNERARDAIRVALAAALREEPRDRYQILVGSDDAGGLTIELSSVAGDAEETA
ncbi:MAG: histidine kinase dimerization/phosphoacceptor domain-containing protein [bacterium]